MLRAPLVRFLVLGGMLYVGVLWLAPDRGPGVEGVAGESGTSARMADRKIRVDREELLAFVQTRTREPSAAATATAFEALDAAGRQLWIDRFVREEALVREARSLGLDRDDELIRRRLVQKMEFLTEGAVRDAHAASDEELAVTYRERADELRVPVSVTFAHVFVRSRDPAARARAAELRASLEARGAGFADSLSQGDRFLYNRHYVDRTIDEVRSHFGADMAATLARLEPDASRWRGPIESEHGWHLVLLTDRSEGRVPSLPEVAPRLREDLARERSDQALEEALRAVVDTYRVELDPDLGSSSDPAPDANPGSDLGDGASTVGTGGETG